MHGLALAFALSLSLQTSGVLILGKPSVKPDVKYDKFDDRTVISVHLGKIPRVTTARNPGSCSLPLTKGGPLKFPNAMIYVVFSRVGEIPKWKDDTLHEVRMVCGEDRIPHLERLPNDYECKSSETFCVETFTLRMNLKQMKETLAKKLDWEVKIDFDDPFVLRAKTRQKMGEYVRFLEEGKG